MWALWGIIVVAALGAVALFVGLSPIAAVAMLTLGAALVGGAWILISMIGASGRKDSGPVSRMPGQASQPDPHHGDAGGPLNRT